MGVILVARSRRRKGPKLPPFVAVPWDVLNAPAYTKLPASAAKALPYFFGRPKVPFSDGQYHEADFPFSYPEAKKLGFASATWFKVLCDLVAHGFLDPVSKGGLRGNGKSCSRFSLSARWKKYGGKDFQLLDLKTWSA